MIIAPLAASLGRTFSAAATQSDVVLNKLQQIGESTVRPFLSIVIIIVVCLVLLRLLRSMVNQAIARVMERGDRSRRELTLRANTLANVIESLGRMIILIVAGMMILSKLGVNIAPLLASAGVVGIAIGLGAQTLIKDFIGGFFILFEDQYGVGDVIAVGTVSGLVEQLSLRRTGLRGSDGSFIIVPNGDIRTVTNMTKGWSRAVIDVAVPYDEDDDRVIAVLHQVVDAIEQDPVVGDAVIAPAEITGIESLTPSEVTIRLLVKTKPMEQWRVQRELRHRIKRAFDEAGIGIPYPRSVHLLQNAADGAQPAEASQPPADATAKAKAT